jgi:hypothetical protein
MTHSLRSLMMYLMVLSVPYLPKGILPRRISIHQDGLLDRGVREALSSILNRTFCASLRHLRSIHLSVRSSMQLLAEKKSVLSVKELHGFGRLFAPRLY